MLHRATVRDRDTSARLRKAVDVTVSSLLLAGYDHAEVTATIRGVMLNALATAPERASVVDAILSDAEMWAERRLETRCPPSAIRAGPLIESAHAIDERTPPRSRDVEHDPFC